MAKASITNGATRQFKDTINGLIVDHPVIEYVEDSATNKYIYKFTKDTDVAYLEIDSLTLVSSRECPIFQIATGYNTGTKLLTGANANKRYIGTNISASVTFVVSDNALMIRICNSSFFTFVYVGFIEKRNPFETRNPFILGGQSTAGTSGNQSFPRYGTASADSPTSLYDTDGTQATFHYCCNDYYGIGGYDPTTKDILTEKMALARGNQLTQIFGRVPEILRPSTNVTYSWVPDGTLSTFGGKTFVHLKTGTGSAHTNFWCLDE